MKELIYICNHKYYDKRKKLNVNK